MKRGTILCVTSVALLALVSLPSVAGEGGPRFQARLVGSTEVPGPGDPDGSGLAQVRLNQGRGEVCFELSVVSVSLPTAAHIHVGASGVPGPVVIALAPPTSGTSTGCVIGVDRGVIRAILDNPSGYYVNVHNAEYPAGAVRGQLGRKLDGGEITGVVD